MFSTPIHSRYKQYEDDIVHFLTFKSIEYELYSIPSFNTDIYLGTISLLELNQSFDPSYFPGPYPIAVRHLSSNTAVVERPPFQIKVDYSPTVSSRMRRPIRPVTIWIPWTVLYVDLKNLSNSKLFFNDGPITSLDDELLIPWTSNIFGDGKFCYGNSSNVYQEINQLLNKNFYSWYFSFMNEYFFGGWNSDLCNYAPYSFHVTAPHLFPSSYSSNDSFEELESSLSSKIKSSKFKFYSSKYNSLKYSNIYYNLSFLTLEQTLQLVTLFKQKEHNKLYPLRDIVLSYSSVNKSFLNSQTIYPSKNLFSSVPVNLNLKINNLSFNETHLNFSLNSYISSLVQQKFKLEEGSLSYQVSNRLKKIFIDFTQNNYVKFLEENSEKILDYVVENKASTYLNYEINFSLFPTDNQILEALEQDPIYSRIEKLCV